MAKEEKKVGDLSTKELAYVCAFTEVGSDTCSQQGKAAQKAGWPEKEAARAASRLMKRPEIRAAIRDIHRKMMDKAMINPSKILVDLENTKNLALAKGDLVSANRSIHLQGQYLTMFGDRYQVDEPEDQHRLNAMEQREARILSKIRLSMSEEDVKRLMGDEYEPEPFTNEEIMSG